MKEPSIIIVAATVFFSSVMLLAGLYLLAKFSSLFHRTIRNNLLRKNIVVWLVAICFILSLTPTRQEFYNGLSNHKILHYFFIQLIAATVEVLFVFNIARIVIQYLDRKNTAFRKKMGVSLIVIIGSCMLICIPINYVANGYTFKNIETGLVLNFYTGCMAGLIYITVSYVDLERKRKLNEKELEVSRLQELKTKAELDALHSKINPHFLYNALNSIADLSITDGKKARKMTIALADLFRFSINYGDNNFSTVKEEVEMAEVYLQIEKIRFEDQLSFTTHIDEDLKYYLVPRFVLQPIVENAVKHGLKSTGKMTEINVEVKKTSIGMSLIVADNGPTFPDSLVPGYGVKSVYDKLDLLFPGNYELHFSNQPRKQVAIYINKLIKDEGKV
jgi:sensor histidine kinase YesM